MNTTTSVQQGQSISEKRAKTLWPEKIAAIRQEAFQIHASVNQYYDHTHPYAFHLECVAENVWNYADEVCTDENDLLPLIFGSYFHDSIEDARLTYNDVRKTARIYMTEEQAHLAAEIVYALTNDKGRTRAERAGEKYYAGIRNTPYAPFVKACDRLANIRYSTSHSKKENSHMVQVYRSELPDFIAHLQVNTPDTRFRIPQQLIASLKQLVGMEEAE